MSYTTCVLIPFPVYEALTFGFVVVVVVVVVVVFKLVHTPSDWLQ